MKKIIVLDNQEVEYTVRKSKRARRLSITIYPAPTLRRGGVYCNASVVVTVPQVFEEDKIEKFLKEKAKWILKKVSYFKRLEQPIRIVGGARKFKKNKQQSYEFACNKIEKINKLYNFSYNKISIKNQKTRWGSCSKKGNLNFNYKIIFLPEKLAEYIVTHELCHLKELNHSRKFWNLVRQTTPDYRVRIKELKKRTLV